jgi:hypothetical protein
MWNPPSAKEVADDVAQCLASGDEPLARRLIYRFIEHYDKASWEDRTRMVATQPDSTGSQRLDAMLAATVEYSCATHRIVAPGWVNNPEYFLDQFWFVSGVTSLEADALANSPISYARRSIFLNRESLTYA